MSYSLQKDSRYLNVRQQFKDLKYSQKLEVCNKVLSWFNKTYNDEYDYRGNGYKHLRDYIKDILFLGMITPEKLSEIIKEVVPQ